MSTRIPSNLIRGHNRIGAILSELASEDAALVLVDHVERMGLQGTKAWSRFLDRHRKRTKTRPEPDRNITGISPEPDRNITGISPEPDRNITGISPEPDRNITGISPEVLHESGDRPVLSQKGVGVPLVSDLNLPLSQLSDLSRNGTDTARAIAPPAPEAAQPDAPVGAEKRVAANAPAPHPEPAGSPLGSGARKRATRPRGSRLSSAWRPSAEQSEWARAQGVDVERTVDVFVDYWVAQPGLKGVKLDWPATFRNWVRREAESGRGGATSSTGPSQAQERRALAMRAEESRKREAEYARQKRESGPPPPEVQARIAALFNTQPLSETRIRTAAEQLQDPLVLELLALDEEGAG